MPWLYDCSCGFIAGLWFAAIGPLDEDRLHGTRCCRTQHVLTLRGVWRWIVPERFLPMQFEDVGSEKTTLSIALTAIEINHYTDGT